MRITSIQAKIRRIQTSIDELDKKLEKPQLHQKTKSIQKKLLALYEELYVLETQSKDNIKVCPVCKKEFIASQKNSVCCSVKCYQHYYYLQKTIAKRQRIRETRPLKEAICKECGKTFLTKTLKNKFCSEECKKEYFRKYSEEYRKKNRDRISELQANYRQSEKYKITRTNYVKSEKGKATLKKYQQSEKYQAYLKEYRKSEKYKEAMKKYRESEKGKATRKKYVQSERYKEVIKRYLEKKKNK